MASSEKAANLTAQAAVGGTALLAAVGSTVALHYCFSPYVHTLTILPSKHNDERNSYQIKALTKNLLTQSVETIFDPKLDVQHSDITRPFCNFLAKGVPMYVHKELIQDPELYTLLLGKEDLVVSDPKQKKDDDDDIF